LSKKVNIDSHIRWLINGSKNTAQKKFGMTCSSQIQWNFSLTEIAFFMTINKFLTSLIQIVKTAS